MRKTIVFMMMVWVVIFVSGPVWADTLEMRDGSLVQGTYLGGTQQTIRFQVDNQVMVYQVNQVLAVTFSSATQPSTQPPVQKTPKQTSQPVIPQPQQRMVNIPAGTRIRVLMTDPVSTQTNRVGDVFKAMLDNDIVVNGEVIFPRGEEVRGTVVAAQYDQNAQTLAITLNELIVQQQSIPITTTAYAVQPKTQTSFGTALKVVERDRALSIPSQAYVDFDTTKPVLLAIQEMGPQPPTQVAQPMPVAPPPSQPDFLKIPAGTRLVVKTAETLDTQNYKQGDQFKGILDNDIIVNNAVVISKGKEVHGKVVAIRQEMTGPELEVTLNEMVVRNQVIPLATTNVTFKMKTTSDPFMTALQVVARDRLTLKVPSQTSVEFTTTDAIKVLVSE